MYFGNIFLDLTEHKWNLQVCKHYITKIDTVMIGRWITCLTSTQLQILNPMARVIKKGIDAITKLNPMAIIRKKGAMHVTTSLNTSQSQK
jgi:hypothetical protein